MSRFYSLEDALDLGNSVIEKPRPGDLFSLATFSKTLGFTDSMWRSIDRAGNVVCARTRTGRIDGFYVANHYALHREEHEMRGLRSAMNVLCNRFKVAPTSLAFGAQVVISAEYRDSDLRLHLLRGLLRTVGLRYRHMFCDCRTDNALELAALDREGWRCFHEEDHSCYFMLDVAKALRGLASQLLSAPARTAPSAERNSLHV